jgi:hypothetical protein
MSIQRKYCKAVATELNRYAVWPPGSSIELGDYGNLEDGTLLKLGNVRESLLPDNVVTERSAPSVLEFTSAGTRVVLLNPKAAVNTPLDPGTAAISAELRISFERANSVYLRAARVTTDEITNLDAVCDTLRRRQRWDFGYVLVSKVTTASKLSLILSATERAEISVQASADVLKAFDSGNAAGNANIAISGDAALKVVGASGPFLFDCVRLRRILGGVKRGAQPGGLAIKPYEPVVAQVEPTS